MRKFSFAIIAGLVLLTSLTLFGKSKNNQVCANSISCIQNMNVDVENDSLGIFNGQKITPPKINLASDKIDKKVLGDNVATGEKHIYVNLSNQTLYAYQGETLFFQTLISSGKWFPTPTGDFKIWSKLRATRMTGGQGADFYDLPNVPFVQFFANNEVSAGRGFSLHGAYWHNNFGHPMSHGCINMRTIDAEKIFYWTDDAPNGTIVTIYGQAPL